MDFVVNFLLIAATVVGQTYNCDLNSDGVVDILDLTFVAANFDTQNPAADINGDGLVDIFDISLVAYAYEDVYQSERQKIYLPVVFSTN